MQVMALLDVLELRAQFVDDLAVIGIAVALDHHQRVGVGLAQQVFGLVDLIGGIHGHEHRA